MSTSDQPATAKPEASRHLLLGVTGGIASGKSTVARMLQDLGAALIDFDVLARRVVAPRKAAFRDIVDYFGSDVLTPDGRIDRKKLAAIVFRHPAQRQKLEQFTHPRIWKLYLKELALLRHGYRAGVVQVVVPLLFEAGLQGHFNRILLVYVPRTVQVQRLVQRDGISAGQAERIISAQMPLAAKLPLADLIVYNEGSRAITRQAVAKHWQTLQKALKTDSF